MIPIDLEKLTSLNYARSRNLDPSNALIIFDHNHLTYLSHLRLQRLNLQNFDEEDLPIPDQIVTTEIVHNRNVRGNKDLLFDYLKKHPSSKYLILYDSSPIDIDVRFKLDSLSLLYLIEWNLDLENETH